ncbi:PhzF family phenazine biosynthesis protein [Deinococcus sp.]|uniref:PhzF family phenazine biosynthesis protein n=1 Tax=Deinococcus sp. TaxID=47478 RepID=UPI003C7DB180
MTDLPALYRVLSPARVPGGKLVAVFPDASGDLQARAASIRTPLSVFIQYFNVSDVVLRVFTPTREKGESDSGALAALSWLFGRGEIADLADIHMNGEVVPAQLCGGEWLLRQGDVTAQEAPAEGAAERLGLEQVGAVHTARISRPTLAVELGGLEELQAVASDPEAVKAVGLTTDTTGLLLYVPGGVPELGHAAVSFRAFGPLRGWGEDAASSNMFACLVGVLGARGLLPEEAGLLRGLQLKPGQPARLSAQFVAQPSGASDVWVGGSALPEQ